MSTSPEEMELRRRRLTLAKARAAYDTIKEATAPTLEDAIPDPNKGFVGPLTDEQQKASDEWQSNLIQMKAANAFGENLHALLSSAITTPSSGIIGLGSLLATRDLNSAVDAINTSQNWGYTPKSPEGQAVMEGPAKIAKGMEMMADAASFAITNPQLNPDADVFGRQELFKLSKETIDSLDNKSPLLSTIVRTAVMGGADLLGLKEMYSANVFRKAAIQDIKQRAANLGLDLGSSNMREAYRQIGENLSTNKTEYEGVADALKTKADQAQVLSDTLYKAFLGTESAVRPKVISNIVSDMENAISSGNYDLARMPEAQSILSDMRKLGQQEEIDINGAYYKIGYVDAGEGVKLVNNPRLKALDIMVGRVNSATNRVKAIPGATAEDKVLQGIIKPRLEEAIEKQYLNDMILGDADAVRLWQQSKNAYQYIKDTFRNNKTAADRAIAELVNNDVSPDKIKRLIFGESTTGPILASTDVVNKIKNIIGADSPQFAGLRAEFAYDIVKPLLQEQPDLVGFINNYEKVLSKRPQLMDALEMNKSQLVDAYQFAKAINKTGGDPFFNINKNRIAAQFLFGHEIAKAAMRRSLAESAITYIRGVGAGEQRSIMREMLGYDPYKAIIPKNSAGWMQFTLDYYRNILVPEEKKDGNTPPEAEPVQ